MRKIILPGLVVYSLLSGLGLFLGAGLSSPWLIPWLAGYLFLVFISAYLSLFVKEQSNGLIFIVLAIIGLNFLIQATGGPVSPLRPAYFLLAAAATFQPARSASVVAGIILFIEAGNLLMSGQNAPGVWAAYAGFAFSLAGVVVIIAPVTRRIKSHARVAQERYRKLLSDANAVDPLSSDISLDALTNKNRQAANVSASVEREGAFKGLIDMIYEFVPAHTYALFLGDRGDGAETFTLRAIRSQSHAAGVVGATQIVRGKGLIGICIDKKQPQYLPDVVIPAKNLGYYVKDVPVKSFLAVPVNEEEKIAGMLVVDSLEQNAFSPEQQDMLVRFAPFFRQIIEKIQFSQELDLRARNFAALHDMSAALNSSLELDEVLDKLTAQVRAVVPYDFCAFVLYDEKRSEAVLTALRGYAPAFIGSRFPIDQSAILYHMFKQWRSTGSTAAYYDPDLGTRGRDIGLFPLKEMQKSLQSLYGRPLAARGKFIGAFFLGSVTANAFAEYYRNFIDTLLNQVSMVIDNTVLHQSIRDMARTDGLTGLLNHRTFMESLSKEHKRLDREGGRFSILLIDIDHFKNVNDKHGHPVGDVALKRIAEILKDTARGADFVARYGGEEFAVGMVGADVRGAEQMAERIRTIVEKTTITAGKTELRITLSVGVAAFPDDSRTMGNLITMADDALYHAKRTGRNRVCLYKGIKNLDTVLASPDRQR